MEEKKEINEMANEFIIALNTGVLKNEELWKRWDKIYVIEQTRWPDNLKDKSRSELSEELNQKLDECITKSQNIARNACQTTELTEAYLQKHR